MVKHNSKGRSKGEAKHIRTYRWEFESEAYRSLCCYARCLLDEIKYRYNGENNGRIPLSLTEAMERLGVGRKAVEKAFRELQERGFIRCTKIGRFTINEASEWALTEYPVGNKLATKDFMRWPSVKYPVILCAQRRESGKKQNVVYLRNTDSAPRVHRDEKKRARNRPYSAPEVHRNHQNGPAHSVPEVHPYSIPPKGEVSSRGNSRSIASKTQLGKIGSSGETGSSDGGAEPLRSAAPTTRASRLKEALANLEHKNGLRADPALAASVNGGRFNG